MRPYRETCDLNMWHSHEKLRDEHQIELSGPESSSTNPSSIPLVFWLAQSRSCYTRPSISCDPDPIASQWKRRALLCGGVRQD
jgi:hypothetical protein